MIRLLIIILVAMAICKCAIAETYKYKNGLVVEASTFKMASAKCFFKLTGGVYPGAEKGLDIIDICANPSKGKID